MNALTAKQWKEAKEGFGLEEVPAEYRREMACCMCGDSPSRGKLYTDQSIVWNYTNVRELQAHIDRLRPNCFCRYHAEQMFGPREEDK